MLAECSSKKTLMKSYTEEGNSKKITVMDYLEEVFVANAPIDYLLYVDTLVGVLELVQQKSVNKL